MGLENGIGTRSHGVLPKPFWVKPASVFFPDFTWYGTGFWAKVGEWILGRSMSGARIGAMFHLL